MCVYAAVMIILSDCTTSNRCLSKPIVELFVINSKETLLDVIIVSSRD